VPMASAAPQICKLSKLATRQSTDLDINLYKARSACTSRLPSTARYNNNFPEIPCVYTLPSEFHDDSGKILEYERQQNGKRNTVRIQTGNNVNSEKKRVTNVWGGGNEAMKKQKATREHA
jgi:hypothetical protein